MELMIVVAIIGILATIAYPSYIDYMLRANRSAAQSFLMDVANKEEQYLLDVRQYTNTIGSLSLTTPTTVSDFYTIGLAADNTATPPTYTVTATPKTGTIQTKDTKCNKLTVKSDGTKDADGSLGATECWRK